MGRATALMFAHEGASVVGCDVTVEAATETVEMVHVAGGQMVSLQPCDLAQRADVDRLMQFAVKHYGGIDVLYNNGAMAYFA